MMYCKTNQSIYEETMSRCHTLFLQIVEHLINYNRDIIFDYDYCNSIQYIDKHLIELTVQPAFYKHSDGTCIFDGLIRVSFIMDFSTMFDELNDSVAWSAEDIAYVIDHLISRNQARRSGADYTKLPKLCNYTKENPVHCGKCNQIKDVDLFKGVTVCK